MKVFLIYDTIKCKFKQQQAIADALQQHHFVIAYDDALLITGFLNKMPNSYEERNRYNVEQIRDLFKTFQDNHFIAFGKVHHIKDINSLNPSFAPVQPQAQPQAKTEYLAEQPKPKTAPTPAKKLEDIVERKSDGFVMHDFSLQEGYHKGSLRMANDEFAINFTGNPRTGSKSWRISLNGDVRELVISKGLNMLLVREDQELGTLHFVFNKEKGVEVITAKNGSQANITNKPLIDFLFNRFGITESQRKERNIIKIGENLAKTPNFLTYKIKEIVKW